MNLVINEWFPVYLRPTAEENELELLFDFLSKIQNESSVLYVRRPSPFLNKIYQLSKQYNSDPIGRRKINHVIKLILRDSKRCKFIDDDEVTLNQTVRDKLNSDGNYISDEYLFEAASCTEEKIIITTDQKLIDFMNGYDGYTLMTPSEFNNN